MPSTLPEGRARGRPVTYVVTEEANESATTRAAAELEPFQLLAVRSHNVKVSGLCCGCGQQLRVALLKFVVHVSDDLAAAVGLPSGVILEFRLCSTCEQYARVRQMSEPPVVSAAVGAAERRVFARHNVPKDDIGCGHNESWD